MESIFKGQVALQLILAVMPLFNLGMYIILSSTGDSGVHCLQTTLVIDYFKPPRSNPRLITPNVLSQNAVTFSQF